MADDRSSPANAGDAAASTNEPADAEDVEELLPEADLDADAEEHLETGLPPRVNQWRRRSATGAMLTGFAFGLREVFEPQRQEPGIVIQTSGEPPTDLPVDAEVDQIRPADNVVTVRPWLLGEEEGQPAAGPAETGTDPGSAADHEDNGAGDDFDDPGGPAGS